VTALEPIYLFGSLFLLLIFYSSPVIFPSLSSASVLQAEPVGFMLFGIPS